jgi:hypothetical protein
MEHQARDGFWPFGMNGTMSDLAASCKADGVKTGAKNNYIKSIQTMHD